MSPSPHCSRATRANRARRWVGAVGALAAFLLAIGCVQVVQAPKPKPEKVPAKIEDESEPELVPTQDPAVMAASFEKVPDVYYLPERERWYRYAWGKWFVAYSWNGNWFPFPAKETPPELLAFEPTPEEKEQRELTREEELAELEKQLREIEAQEALERGEAPPGITDREKELQRLDEELRRIEEEERREREAASPEP